MSPMIPIAPCEGKLIRIDNAMEVFKKWLKEIPLGGSLDDSPVARQLRHDFILMVDEPSLGDVVNREIAEEQAREVKMEQSHD